MKRYPNGADGKCFFMKRAPSPRPEWIETCAIEHASGNIIDFPMVQDLASLLWVVNLGCIDLNPWYARCDDVDRPDYLHFDLDPGRANAVRARARGRAHRARRARAAGHADLREDDRLERHAHLRADRSRSDAERRCGRSRRHSRRAVAAKHPKITPRSTHREAAARPRARRLQPERLGHDARVGLLGAPDARGDACRRR